MRSPFLTSSVGETDPLLAPHAPGTDFDSRLSRLEDKFSPSRPRFVLLCVVALSFGCFLYFERPVFGDSAFLVSPPPGEAAETTYYDFIVIGAGPAGSVLSRRLVDKGFDVLLVEAGGPMQYDVGGGDFFGGPITRFDIPLLWHAAVDEPSEYVWQGFNVPHVTVGKGVGGSAALDAMIYTRCTPADIEAWNVTGWTWERVLGAYVAMEDFAAQGDKDIPYFHGPDISSASLSDRAGSNRSKADPMRRLSHEAKSNTLNEIFRIRTAPPGYIDELSRKFVDSAVAYGLARSEDFNDPNGGRSGAGYYFFNIRNGIRDSAAVRMLAPLLFRNGRRGAQNVGVFAEDPDLNVNWNREYINGKSNDVYGKGVGRLQLTTHSVVTKVLFATHHIDENTSGVSFASSVGNESSFGNGGTDRLRKGNLSASGGDGGGCRGAGGEGGDALSSATDQSGQVNGDHGFADPRGAGYGGGGSIEGKVNGLVKNIPSSGTTLQVSASITASGGGGGGSKGGGGGGGAPGGGGGGGDAFLFSDVDTSSEESRYHQGLKRRTYPKYNAIGVEYVVNGEVRNAYIKKGLLPGGDTDGVDKDGHDANGVVLTAGAIMTPKILMNSGVGPSSVLRDSNTPLLINSPHVGRHLKDHPAVGLVAVADPSLFSGNPSAFEMAMNWGRYVESVIRSRSDLDGKCQAPAGFGIAGSAGISAGAFLTSPYSNEKQPDIQLTVFSKTPTLSPQGSANLNDRRMLQVTVALLSPDAEREVVLNEADPVRGTPKLFVFGKKTEIEYLSSRDVAVLSWGIEETRKILSSAPLSLDMITCEISPGPELRHGDAKMERWIRENVYIYSHWVGTVRMGNSKNSNDDVDIDDSAADPKLRVRGTSNLFVADASIMPKIPNGNVHSTVAMIGYQAADLITSAKSD